MPCPSPHESSDNSNLHPDITYHFAPRSSLIAARLASSIASKLTADRRESESLTLPSAPNRTSHRCSRSTAFSPTLPSFLRPLLFTLYLSGVQPPARSPSIQTLRLRTHHGSNSRGDKITVLMAPILNPPRGATVAARDRLPSPPAILTLTPDRTCSPTLSRPFPSKEGRQLTPSPPSATLATLNTRSPLEHLPLASTAIPTSLSPIATSCTTFAPLRSAYLRVVGSPNMTKKDY
jgi:hypothetical protein